MVDRKSIYTILDKAIDRRAEAIDSVVYRMSNYNKIETINAQKY